MNPRRKDVHELLEYLETSLKDDREMLDDEEPHSEIHDPDDEETRIWNVENEKLTRVTTTFDWLVKFLHEEMDETGEFDDPVAESNFEMAALERDPIDEVEAYRG
jgi:hypothetical protein